MLDQKPLPATWNDHFPGEENDPVRESGESGDGTFGNGNDLFPVKPAYPDISVPERTLVMEDGTVIGL